MSEGLFAYFGYGSLVNRDTLRTQYVSVFPARLHGWRRFWQPREKSGLGLPGADAALLSVFSHSKTSIDGVVIVDHLAHLPALDEREEGYRRHRLSLNSIDFPALENKAELPDEIFVYVADERQGTGAEPLMQSYVDAVMLGFFKEHGEAGLLNFLATTDGFSRPIISDRHQPLYPRSVSVDEETARRFDALLAEHGVQFEPSRT